MFPKLYPHVSGLRNLDQTAKGPFPEGKPLGAVIHYSADRDLDRSVRALTEKDLGYHLIIDRLGGITQMVSFDKKCWHAGNAVWSGRSPNHHFLAICLLSWGYLVEDKGQLKSWSGAVVSKEESAIHPHNITGIKQPWDIATSSQLISLLQILEFLAQNGISRNMICGHDECALPPGRKSDPGGVLPLGMESLRKLLMVAPKGASNGDSV